MITLFSIPKAFDDDTGVIQRNALRSWIALADDVQVILVGDEEGATAAAAEVGAVHIRKVAANEYGTPLLDDAFARVDEIARHPLRCFVNGDIILLDDFIPAAQLVRAAGPAFLMIGESRDLSVTEALDLERPEVRDELRRRALTEGRTRGATAIDYFVYTAGLFDPMPPFVVGRARFDNWLVWRARRHAPVVDASRAVVAVHQAHGYGHIAGGLEEAHFGAEAKQNLELAGGKERLFTIYDASHRLGANGSLRPNCGSVLRVRENLRKLAWKLSRR